MIASSMSQRNQCLELFQNYYTNESVMHSMEVDKDGLIATVFAGGSGATDSHGVLEHMLLGTLVLTLSGYSRPFVLSICVMDFRFICVTKEEVQCRLVGRHLHGTPCWFAPIRQGR